MSVKTETREFNMLNADGYMVTVKPEAMLLGVKRDVPVDDMAAGCAHAHECIACFKCDGYESKYKIQFGTLISYSEDFENYEHQFMPKATLYVDDEHSARDIIEYMTTIYDVASALVKCKNTIDKLCSADNN